MQLFLVNTMSRKVLDVHFYTRMNASSFMVKKVKVRGHGGSNMLEIVLS